MKTTSLRARTLACALLATTAFCGLTAQPAAAQPAHRALDSNGVDLTHGDFVMALVEGSIGSGEGELALVRDGVWQSGYNGHVWDSIRLSEGSGNRSVSFGRRAEYFTGTASLQGNGSTLVLEGGAWVHRSADGTRTVFTPLRPDCAPTGSTSCQWVPASITTPDGRETVLGWEPWEICPEGGVGTDNPCTVADVRLSGISNSRGYSILFTYASMDTGGPGGPPLDWFRRSRADFYNQAVGTDSRAHVLYEYPSNGIIEVIDTGNRRWRIAGSFQTVTAIRRPGANADTTTVSYDGPGGTVSSVTNEGVTTNYALSAANGTMTVTQVDPDGPDPVTTIVSDPLKGRPTLVTDPLQRTTGYQYDGSGRLERVTRDEGNYVHYSYDGRGNVIRVEAFPKGGSGPTIVTTALYPDDCSLPSQRLVCNQPLSTTDERGNTTEYTYHAGHGGVETVTGPAVGGVRPQTRYTYSLFGSEYRLTGISACRNPGPELVADPAACVGGANEVKTTIAYDSNGNVASTTTGSGDGDPAQTATTMTTWNPMGDVKTVDGPLPGPDDRSWLHYAPGRRLKLAVSPDPDGPGGALLPRATRTLYDSATGLPNRTEIGNVTDPADEDGPGFVARHAVETVYDSSARPVTTRLIGGSTVHALTQIYYDGLGRPDCTAQRMNLEDFETSLPTECTLTSTVGGRTADRIVKTVYDAAGQVTKVQTAVGTSDPVDEVTTTYTDNGLVRTVTDAENNKTTYDYDGLDRLLRTYYPLPARGSGLSATAQNTANPDYEESGYEPVAGGAHTSPLHASFRNRSGDTTVFTYDALGRMTHKNLPGSELDVGYGHDLLGQLTSASHSGSSLTFGYDALGRNVRQSGVSGDYESTYDPAGRRIRIDHPDAFFVTQDYNFTGEMTAIRENGAGLLATFEYDQLGRRDRLILGNGAVTDYDYDDASRLKILTHDLGGTAYDNEIGFHYNPAGQIVRREASNNAYAWTGHGEGTTTYAVDGLNRLVSKTTGPTVTGYGHDALGDRLNDDTRSYAYDSETKGLGSPSAPWHHDPLGRLSGASTSPASPPAIVYESHVDNLVAERASGSSTVQRRHVFGPGVDEPLVWYEGSGTTGRRFLHADERGSIVAVTSDAGALLAINRYDEYGRTETTNGAYAGRFLYTGQRWFGGFGLYHYKNRIYDPRTGRFMQPDPVGYEAGLNLYAYVDGDPVNWTDPFGLEPKEGDKEDEDAGSSPIFVTGVRAASAAAGALFRRGGGNGIPSPVIDAVEALREQEITITAQIDRQQRRGKNYFKQVVTYPWRAFVHAIGLGRKPRPPRLLEAPCGCFEAGTEVSTPSGLRPIEEIKVGDLVLAYNELTGKIGAKPVISLIRPENKRLYELTFVNANGQKGSYSVTDDHPWKIEGKGWVETQRLAPSDRIVTYSGQDLIVESVEVTEHRARTYNLTVADWHTFIVGPSGAIVHNANCFTHNYKYDPRVRKRALEDPSGHNFPYSYDDEILRQPPTVRPDGSRSYQLRGYLGGRPGVFEIGLNPSRGVIFHRMFRRD